MDVEREIDKLDTRVGTLEALAIGYQLQEIKTDLRDLKVAFEDRRREREKERKETIEDKRTDFKWKIGTALFSAGLIISAMAVLLAVFGSGGT